MATTVQNRYTVIILPSLFLCERFKLPHTVCLIRQSNKCSCMFSSLVSMEEFLDAAASRLPTLRGLKYTDYNLMELGRCLVGNGGKYDIMYGRDEVSICSCMQ